MLWPLLQLHSVLQSVDSKAVKLQMRAIRQPVSRTGYIEPARAKLSTEGKVAEPPNPPSQLGLQQAFGVEDGVGIVFRNKSGVMSSEITSPFICINMYTV